LTRGSFDPAHRLVDPADEVLAEREPFADEPAELFGWNVERAPVGHRDAGRP
jgi:hypothetical protein